MTRRALSALAVITIALLATGATGAADAAQPWTPGELIVKFRPGVSAPEKGALVRGKPLKALRFIGAEQWLLDDAGAVATTAAALEADPRVEYAEPNYLIHTLGIPSDPLFDRLWGLHNTGQMVGTVIGVPGADIDAVAAWEVATGSAAVTVAVIDTGIDTSHPDLAPNLWTNAGEIAGNGIDDDGNGFIDDIHGWDFINNDNDPMDDNSHGTHCAGTIGAVADNGAGVAGVNWNVRLMALKFQDAGGEGTTVDAIECIAYATLMGVDVMSNSWGSGARSTPLQAAIQAAADADIFFVAAAGNSGLDNDNVPFFPASYDVGNVITVMATDCTDQPAVEATWASNYGATAVDIAAPGVRVWSTIRNNGYMYLSGTSMAAPYVAGGLALLRSRFPDISVADGRFLLMNVGNDPLPSLYGKCVAGARLNLRRLIADPDTIPPAAVTDLAIVTVASNWLTLDWTTPGDDGTLVSYDLRWAATPIVDEAGWAAATPVTGEPEPVAIGAWATMRVEGLPAATMCYFSLCARDEYGNVGGLSNSPGGATQAPPEITVMPSGLSAAVASGGTALRTLTITNTGQGVLDFTIPRQGPAKPWTTTAEAAGGEAAAAGASGRVDAYGYDWSDNDTPGGPSFNWIDISSQGTAVSLTDESSRGPFNLGFTFPFYGRDFTTFYVSANGCVNFAGVWTPGVNVALPSASASGYLLALLWDQLTPGVGTCRYFSDGNRMIVQYTNVDNSGAGGPYTMQMHLYATGVIEYHYRTLVAPASGSATIGIQNGDGSDGLTVAYNTAYVHDNLAVRFLPPPTWLSVSPDNGNLDPGTSVDVAVRFDSDGQCGSHFAGNLRVLSNDPAAPCLLVPAGLAVANPPDIATDPAGVAFGAVRFGLSSTRTFAVTNISCGDLTIHSLDFDSGAFTSPQALPLVVPFGATASVPVTFAPLAPAPFTGTVTLGSDDPDTPTLAVPLSGTGLDVPDIVVSPASMAETLPTGGTSTRTLTITNAGLTALTYTIAAPEYVSVVDKGAGGPDTYGYVWTDSDAMGGPAYNWIEISTIGTQIPFTGDDENRGPMPIGFSFPFYGSVFTTYRINANGWISFTSTATGYYTNRTLPSTSAPENLVAPYWDDLTFVNALGRAYRYFDGQRLIIEYVAVPRDGVAGTCTFQTHLYPNGRIEFHYRDMPMTLDSATIGIQNAARTSGLAIAWNTRYVHNNLAVRIDGQQHWLSTSATGGTLAAGASADITLGFDALGLCSRTCLANLRINSNDIDSPQVVVPVSLTAVSGPAARFSPTSLAFGDVYVSQSPILAASLASLGCASLQVTGLAIDNPVFVAGVTVPFTLVAGASKAFNVTCTPVAAGAITGTMTLTTDDPSRPTISVPLSATVYSPPGAAVNPGTLAMTVQPNRQRTATVRLENSGAGALNYSIASPTLIDKAAGAGTVRADSVAGAEGDASVLGTGGPDAYGYRWLDSDAPGGPVFSWIEIAGSGAMALTSGGNVSSSQCQLGFNVGLYGPQYTSFYVGSEGFLAFQPFGFNSGGNATIPSSLGAPAMVAPFWDDLDLDAVGSGDVWYKKVDGNMVVEWDHVMRAGTSTPVTFEAIIKPSGQIIFQYLSVSQAVTNSATIGIQNAAQTVGLRIAYNAPYVHDNLAVQIWLMPQWATVSPSAGNIPPGGSTDLTVTFNTTGLPVTTHHGQLNITSNDLLHPTLTIPLTLTVLDYPSGVDGGLPRALSLAQNAPNPFNPRTLIRFGLPAKGMVDLRIYDVSGRLVRTLVNGEMDAGTHDYLWDGRTDAGASSPSGVYFYRLKTAAGDLTRSMTLIR